MKKNKYKICVIGAGHWGRNHIRTLHQLNALGGVVEQDINAVNSIRSKYPACKFYLDLESVFNDDYDDYDGFIVATPPLTHFEIAKKIIESGKPLLVEKPLTLNMKDAVELNNLAKKNNVNLMVGHLLLFHPAFKKIKDIIKSGMIGEIQYIYSNRLNLGTFRSDENVFWSFAPHDISLFHYFFENSPIEITSSGNDILQKGIHDTTITSFIYNDKKMGHIFVSWLHPFKEHRFVIIGSEGMIHFEDSSEHRSLLLYDKKAEFSGGIPIPKSGITRKIQYEKELPLTNELKYFLSHLNGKKVKIADGDSAVEVIRILELATISLKRNF